MSIKDYLTIVIEGQLFGIEAVSIHDVFYIYFVMNFIIEIEFCENQ